MSISIREIISQEEWTEFFNSTRSTTFLHAWEWGVFHELCRMPIFRFGIFDHTGLCGIALFICMPARRGRIFFCPHGPLFVSTMTDADIRAALHALWSYVQARARTERCVCIRISPLMQETLERRGLFKVLGFRNAPIHMHSERGWILDITPDEETLLSHMRKTTRYCIRKAMKEGVEIVVRRDPSDVATFLAVYRETVARHHFVPFSQEYLEKECRAFGKNAVWFFARYRNTVCAAALIIFTPFSAFYHHGASSRAYERVVPAYLLQWEAIREARRRGCQQYNFWGIVPDDARGHPWAGVSQFKKGFGGFSESYIHAQDYVLSWRYWMLYSIETIRRLRRRL